MVPVFPGQRDWTVVTQCSDDLPCYVSTTSNIAQPTIKVEYPFRFPETPQKRRCWGTRSWNEKGGDI